MRLAGPRCLGKHPPRHDPRTLLLRTYLADALPSPPPARDWTAKLPENLGAMRNTELGDCAIAAPGHMIQCWTGNNAGGLFTPADEQIVAAYSAVSGYSPDDPASDQGCNMLDVLRYWRTVGIAGRKIRAFVKLDHADVEQVKTAINLFGAIYVGASLPISAQHAGPWFHSPSVVSKDNAIGSWGGHAMAVGSYDRLGPRFLTWGYRQPADWEWFLRYVDEAYAVVDQEWFSVAGLAPNGFDMSALTSDLARLAA